MFSLNDSSRYFMYRRPVLMTLGMGSLFELIRAESPLSPIAGDVFVFFSQNRQCVKLLKWDNDGFLLYQKRLEQGSFEVPKIKQTKGFYELSWETIRLILDGISLGSVHYRDRYRTRQLFT